jgi:transposase-like protein
MTKRKVRTESIDVKELLKGDEDLLWATLQAATGRAGSGDHRNDRGGERRAHHDAASLSQRCNSRALTTLVGTLELRVPLDRMGRFSTELFQR